MEIGGTVSPLSSWKIARTIAIAGFAFVYRAAVQLLDEHEILAPGQAGGANGDGTSKASSRRDRG